MAQVGLGVEADGQDHPGTDLSCFVLTACVPARCTHHPTNTPVPFALGRALLTETKVESVDVSTQKWNLC